MSDPAPVMPEKPGGFTGMILRGGAAGAAGLTLFVFAWLLLAARFTGRMDGQTAMAFPVTGALGWLIGSLVGMILAFRAVRRDGGGVRRRLAQLAIAVACIVGGVVPGVAIGVAVMYATIFMFAPLLLILVAPVVVATLVVYRRLPDDG